MTKRVFISAGAAGIGRVIAEHFLAGGAEVAICDADANAVREFASDHPETSAYVADITSEPDMVRVFGELDTKWPHVDVVCANAGTGGPAGQIEDLEFEQWQSCIATNLHGAFLTCRWAARRMKPQGSGLITLTSSTAGIMGYPFRSPYAAAKWGIVGLTKTLAMELGPYSVRVNAICPGAVEGPRMDRIVQKEAEARGLSQEDVRDLYVKGVSMRTWVTADDVANTIGFLASDTGNKISGQILSVDGHTETLSP